MSCSECNRPLYVFSHERVICETVSRKVVKMKKIKKIMEIAISAVVLLALLEGCAHTSQSEEQSNTDDGRIDTDSQVVGAQDETNTAAGAEQHKTVFIDEKLDENLFISAELNMPEKILYEYATQLKSFDYAEVQKAIGQNEEGNLDIDDGNDGFTSGSLTYQRNDMANHLDTYCSYAREMGLTEDRELSFMPQADAVARMELTGLNPDDKKRVGNYSLGMRQRLGIAQALMENPDILILDEPMNALDSNGVEDIRMVLLKMKENGKLILIASHVRDDIDILCDEVYGMDGGILKKIR